MPRHVHLNVKDTQPKQFLTQLVLEKEQKAKILTLVQVQAGRRRRVQEQEFYKERWISTFEVLE